MNPVDRLLRAIQQGRAGETDAFTADATLDATVPNWRFSLSGADAIRRQFAHWYPAPRRFEELKRLPTPSGEVVMFAFLWEEDGEPIATRQVHVLTVSGGRITSDSAWCGGQWPAWLMAEMEAAAASA